MKERKPGGRKGLALRRKRIARAAGDVARGLKDTERRGVPNEVPSAKRRSA